MSTVGFGCARVDAGWYAYWDLAYTGFPLSLSIADCNVCESDRRALSHGWHVKPQFSISQVNEISWTVPIVTIQGLKNVGSRQNRSASTRGKIIWSHPKFIYLLLPLELGRVISFSGDIRYKPSFEWRNCVGLVKCVRLQFRRYLWWIQIATSWESRHSPPTLIRLLIRLVGTGSVHRVLNSVTRKRGAIQEEIGIAWIDNQLRICPISHAISKPHTVRSSIVPDPLKSIVLLYANNEDLLFIP